MAEQGPGGIAITFKVMQALVDWKEEIKQGVETNVVRRDLRQRSITGLNLPADPATSKHSDRLIWQLRSGQRVERK